MELSVKEMFEVLLSFPVAHLLMLESDHAMLGPNTREALDALMAMGEG